jgi:hypothetical protein
MIYSMGINHLNNNIRIILNYYDKRAFGSMLPYKGKPSIRSQNIGTRYIIY